MKMKSKLLIAGVVAGATAVVLRNEKIRNTVAGCAEKVAGAAMGLAEMVLNQDSDDKGSSAKCPYKVQAPNDDIEDYNNL